MNLASIQVPLSYIRVFCRSSAGVCTGSVAPRRHAWPSSRSENGSGPRRQPTSSWSRPQSVDPDCGANCSVQSARYGSQTQGAVVGTATGGVVASTGGVVASTGGVVASTGGVVASTGGVVASTEGVVASTGGVTATGGMTRSAGRVTAFI